ncbi:hypothetical protein AGMMS50255_8280 [Spirochaetia bacterium]|nr:hypothetical protein AGMMS50255_8280 [Spirochaetia bacterium]
MKFRKGRALPVLAGLVLIAAIPAGIFFARSPALILSDASFDALYGARRASIARVQLSLRLFRPVKKVLIAESAGPEAAAFALEEASERPWGAILPVRYARGGQRYAEDHGGTPVAITEGRESRRDGNLSYIAADTRLDAYRAGRCAAILAQAGDGAGNILFFQAERNFPFDRESFLAGLREEGFMEDPVFLSPDSNYSSYENVSCVVLTGQARNFFDRNVKVPVILFSWLDPALTPANVKVIFDDSPWVLAFAAFRDKGEAKSLPANIIIPKERITNPAVLRKMKSAIREEIPQ